MTDYTELIRSLRCENTGDDECGSSDCPYWSGLGCMDGQLMADAAAAIEALQAEVERLKAENPIVETVLVDKMRQQMEETVCHCNVKENAELIAKILDDDVDGKVYQMPKRCEIVRCGECKYFNPHIMECEGIGKWFGLENEWSAYDYCSKGERKVQDENHE